MLNNPLCLAYTKTKIIKDSNLRQFALTIKLMPFACYFVPIAYTLFPVVGLSRKLSSITS